MHAETRRYSEGGFSLLEMLIVMVIMMSIMGAVMTLMKSSLNVSNATYELTDARENLRIAHEYINRDIINAGYGLNDYSKIQVTRAFVTTYLAKNITSTMDPANSFGIEYVNLGLVWSDADPGSLAVTDSNPATNVLDNTDRITILRLDPAFNAISLPAGKITAYGASVSMPYDPDGKQLKVGEIYFFTSGTSTGFGRITAINTAGATTTVSLDAGNSYGLNKPGATGPLNVIGSGSSAGVSTKDVNMRRVFISHYYVNSKNELMKREFGVAGTGFTENLVAEHITGLSFRYIFGKNNANGTVQQPVSQLTSWSQQDSVRQIEIKIKGETTHSINFQKNQKGEETMTSIASARNLQFRTAQQPKKP